MATTLRELKAKLKGFALDFDPALYPAQAAARVRDDAAEIEKMAAAIKALAAKRVVETGTWRGAFSCCSSPPSSPSAS